MSLERVKVVSAQIMARIPVVKWKGEEATKQALVLPMLDALGYDIWSPAEVCPEYDADFAIKKAGQKEKVDVAIFISGTPRIYVEVKAVETSLDGHDGQLARYFNATPSVTLGVLTNGVEWRFYTDTGDPNIMDAQPFHVARLDVADQGLDVLARFAKAVFCPEAIRDYATELRYTTRIADFLRCEMDLRDREPGEYFVRWMLKSEGMYGGVVNQNVVDRFRPIAKAALTRVVREIVRRSLSAMEEEAARAKSTDPVDVATASSPSPVPASTVVPGTVAAVVAGGDQGLPPQQVEQDAMARKIVTTDSELNCFAVVKAIFEQSEYRAKSVYDASSRRDVPIVLSYKDTTAYFGVYLNKPGWWVARILMEAKQPWIGFNIDPAVGERLLPPGAIRLSPYAYAPLRIGIRTPDDIMSLAAVLLATVAAVVAERPGSGSGQGSGPASAAPSAQP